jgi:hypothetical protein
MQSVLCPILICLACVSFAVGQTFTNNSQGGFTQATSPGSIRSSIGRDTLRTADATANPAAAATTNPPAVNLAPTTPNTTTAPRTVAPRTPIAVAQGQPSLGKITAGNGVLPNDAGQVWREYDIKPYTSRIQGVENPQQAVVDWILRETGTDVWFSAPLGILNADKNTLRVYHTSQMQEMVKGIYDRFMSNSAEVNNLGLRIITVNSPNWRSQAMTRLKPVDVKSPGVEAWLLPRDIADQFLNQMRQRADYREFVSSVVQNVNGQTSPINAVRPRNFVKSIRPRTDAIPSYEPQMATLMEGYALSLSSLAAADGRSLDIVVKCDIDQIERLIDVPLDIPTPLGGAQRVTIQVPQLVSWRLHERFRWPTDHILLLSCGVVAAPGVEKPTIPLLGGFMQNPRADALLFIDPLQPTQQQQPLATLPPAVLSGNTAASPFSSNPVNPTNTNNNTNSGTNFNPFIATPAISPNPNVPWRR